MVATETHGWHVAARCGVLAAGFGPALLYTDVWAGGHSILKYLILTVGAGTALLATGFVRLHPTRTRLTFPDVAMAAYVAWLAVATIAAPEPLLSVTGYRPYWDGLAAAVAAGAVYFAGRTLLASDRDVWRHLAQGAAATSAVLAVALVPAYLGWAPFASLVRSGRAGSLMGQPTFLAGFAVIWLPLLVLACRAAWRTARPDVATNLLRIGAPVAALLLFATLSRAGWLGTAVGLALWAILAAPDTKARLVRGGLAVLAGAVIVVALLFARAGGDSLGARQGAWSYAWRSAIERPVAGTGPGTYVYTYLGRQTPENYRLEPNTVLLDAHDWYLNTASTAGMPGALAALGIALGAVVTAVRARKRGGSELAAACGVVGYAVHTLFTPNSMATFAGAMLLLGVAAARQAAPNRAKEAAPGAQVKAVSFAAAILGVALALCGVRTTVAEVAYARSSGRGDFALAALADRLAPEVPVYALQHAGLLVRTGAYEGAALVLAEARRRLPRDPELAKMAGQLMETVPASGLPSGERRAAVTWLSDAAAMAPAFPSYRGEYALALARSGDRAAALRELATLRESYGDTDPYVASLAARLQAPSP